MKANNKPSVRLKPEDVATAVSLYGVLPDGPPTGRRVGLAELKKHVHVLAENNMEQSVNVLKVWMRG